VIPTELQDQPECPEYLAHVWGWFVEIRSGGSFSWAEVDAWARLKGVQLSGYDTELLSMLNGVFMSVNGRCN